MKHQRLPIAERRDRLHVVTASLIVARPTGGSREELRDARHIEIRILLSLEHAEDRMRREHEVRARILDDRQIARCRFERHGEQSLAPFEQRLVVERGLHRRSDEPRQPTAGRDIFLQRVERVGRQVGDVQQVDRLELVDRPPTQIIDRLDLR